MGKVATCDYIIRDYVANEQELLRVKHNVFWLQMITYTHKDLFYLVTAHI